MNSEAFVLDCGQFDFGSSEESSVSFLGPDADHQKTHVTLIAGANGTSKSRLLASIVEQFCEIQGKQEGKAESSRRYSTTGTHGVGADRKLTI